jgi:hypothetical protein
VLAVKKDRDIVKHTIGWIECSKLYFDVYLTSLQLRNVYLGKN